MFLEHKSLQVCIGNSFGYYDSYTIIVIHVYQETEEDKKIVKVHIDFEV